MGGLRKYMPRTFWTFLIATVAIAGIPGFSGFFSKDEILWRAYLHDPVLWLVGFIAAGMTAFYMFRAVFMTFFGELRAGHGHGHHGRHEPHESSGWMTWPLVVLAIGSMFSGYLGVPAALGGSNVFEGWLEPVFGHGGHAAGAVHASLALEYGLMAASVGVAVFGITLAYLMYNRHVLDPAAFASAAGGVPYRLVFNKYYVDEIYYATFLAGTLALSRVLAWFDRTVIDGLVNGAAAVTRVTSWINGRFDLHIIDGLVNATAGLIHGIAGATRRVQTGSINAYLYVIVIVVTVVLFARTW
jgi:NADH-quinone oxidoreductase subunit L